MPHFSSRASEYSTTEDRRKGRKPLSVSGSNLRVLCGRPLQGFDDGDERGIHRTINPEPAAEIDDGAVQMIDFGGTAFQQVLPHRGNVARRGEDAVDRLDDVEVEGHAVGTSDGDAF